MAFGFVGGEMDWKLGSLYSCFSFRMTKLGGRDNGGKRGRVFRNICKGHMDKTKRWVEAREGDGFGWGSVGSGGG